jgi:hypothetical protein
VSDRCRIVLKNTVPIHRSGDFFRIYQGFSYPAPSYSIWERLSAKDPEVILDRGILYDYVSYNGTTYFMLCTQDNSCCADADGFTGLFNVNNEYWGMIKFSWAGNVIAVSPPLFYYGAHIRVTNGPSGDIYVMVPSYPNTNSHIVTLDKNTLAIKKQSSVHTTVGLGQRPWKIKAYGDFIYGVGDSVLSKFTLDGDFVRYIGLPVSWCNSFDILADGTILLQGPSTVSRYAWNKETNIFTLIASRTGTSDFVDAQGDTGVAVLCAPTDYEQWAVNTLPTNITNINTSSWRAGKFRRFPDTNYTLSMDEYSNVYHCPVVMGSDTDSEYTATIGYSVMLNNGNAVYTDSFLFSTQSFKAHTYPIQRFTYAPNSSNYGPNCAPLRRYNGEIYVNGNSGYYLSKITESNPFFIQYGIEAGERFVASDGDAVKINTFGQMVMSNDKSDRIFVACEVTVYNGDTLNVRTLDAVAVVEFDEWLTPVDKGAYYYQKNNTNGYRRMGLSISGNILAYQCGPFIDLYDIDAVGGISVSAGYGTFGDVVSGDIKSCAFSWETKKACLEYYNIDGYYMEHCIVQFDTNEATWAEGEAMGWMGTRQQLAPPAGKAWSDFDYNRPPQDVVYCDGIFYKNVQEYGYDGVHILKYNETTHELVETKTFQVASGRIETPWTVNGMSGGISVTKRG